MDTVDILAEQIKLKQDDLDRLSEINKKNVLTCLELQEKLRQREEQYSTLRQKYSESDEGFYNSIHQQLERAQKDNRELNEAYSDLSRRATGLLRTIQAREIKIKKYEDKISERESQLDGVLEELEELESEKDKTAIPDCEVCGRDTYEQQQNYERIKEELFIENEELKKKLAQYTEKANLSGYITKRGRDSWRIQLYVGKDNGQYKRYLETVRGSYEDAKKRLGELNKERDNDSLHSPKYLKEEFEALRHQYRDMQEKYTQAEAEKIEYMQAGFARR